MKKIFFFILTIGGAIGTIIGVVDAMGCMEDAEKCVPWAQETAPCSFQVEGLDTEIEVFVLAGQLAEMGYFTSDLKTASYDEVQDSLKEFQRDLRVPATGQILPDTWEKLAKIKMSAPIQKELLHVLGSCQKPTFWEVLFPW